MSQYFYGVCHDCHVLKEVSNVNIDHAEQIGSQWAQEAGHSEHKFEVVSEYTDTYENVFSRYREVE